MDYAVEGNLKKIKGYYKEHDTLDVSDYDGRNILHIASSYNHLHIIEYIIKRKLIDCNKTDKYDRQPIEDALLSYNINIINYLKDKTD